MGGDGMKMGYEDGCGRCLFFWLWKRLLLLTGR